MPSERVRQTLGFIASNVRFLREQRGWTQAELAERAELDLRQVQRIEGGRTNVGVGSFIAVAEALGASLGTLAIERALVPRRPGRPRKIGPAPARGQLHVAESTLRGARKRS